MRFAFLLPPAEAYSTEWSGAIATITRHLAHELEAENHEAIVLGIDDGGTPYSEGTYLALRPSPRPTSFSSRVVAKARAAFLGTRDSSFPRYWSAARATLAELQPRADVVVIANDPFSADKVARAGLSSRVVLWLHNRLEGAEAVPFHRLDPRVQIVTVSDAVRQWTAPLLSGRRIDVIYSGVDHRMFHPRDDWEDSSDALRVICHGRLDPNKGFETAAQAVTLLRREGLPVELTVIGEVRTFGFEPDEVASFELRLEGELNAAGATRHGWMPQSELAVQLREHDIACVLSRVDDPFALVNLESMASGLALIGTRKGGIPEAIGDGGVLVAAEAPDEVAGVIRHWVQDREQLREAKASALRRAREFTWAKTARGLIELVDRMS